MSTEGTEAEKIAELALTGSRQPQTVLIEHGGVKASVLLVPDASGGYAQHCVKKLLEPYRDAPERRVGIANLTDLDSFVLHAKRFADKDSAIFADRTSTRPALVSVLDYHRAGADASPRFGQHRGVYAFPLSPEWQAWTSQNGKAMDQEDFARWIEDHLTDVADPASVGEVGRAFVDLLQCGFATPNALLTLSRGLEVKVGMAVAKHVKLSSGETTFAYDETHSDADGSPLKVPGAFLLGLQVFRNGAAYQVPTRLRYKVANRAVTWSFEMARVQDVLDDALREACAKVATETGLPILEGSPE